jgi:hypothetical protein
MGETEAGLGTVAPELGDCVSVGDQDSVGEPVAVTERVLVGEGDTAGEPVPTCDTVSVGVGVEDQHRDTDMVSVEMWLTERVGVDVPEVTPEGEGREEGMVGVGMAEAVLVGTLETVGCVEGSVLVAMADAVGKGEAPGRDEVDMERVTEMVAEEDAMLAEGARDTVTVGEEVWLCESVTESEMVGVGPGEMTVMVGDRDAEVDRLPVTDTTGEAVMEAVVVVETDTELDADTAAVGE